MSEPVINFNAFDYKAITFLEFLTQIETHPLFVNKPQWLKVLLAGRSDVLASYIDARANNNMLASVYTLEAGHNRAATLGYLPGSAQPASGVVTVNLKIGTALPVMIPAAELVFSTSENVGGSPVYYSSDIDVLFTAESQNINVIEGRVYTDEPGNIFSGGAFEEFKIERLNVIKGTITLIINAVEWTEVNNLLASQVLDTHYKVILRETGDVIRCGDGQMGQTFPAGFSPQITARYGGGTRGYQLAGKVGNYVGASNLIASVLNESSMVGGQGAESLASIKTYAPLNIIAQDRAVTAPDFLYHSEVYPGVSRAFVEPNYIGPGSVRVQVVPNGGGSPSPTIKNGLALLLKSKSLLSNIPVLVDDTLYQPVDVQIEMELGTAVAFVDVEDYMRLGVIFLLHETTKELKEIRESEGVVSLITTINNYFGFTFDAESTVVQKNIIVLLDVVTVTEWGKDIFQNIFFTVADAITGVDFIDLIEPSSTVDIATAPIALATTGNIVITPRNKPERTATSTLSLVPVSIHSLLTDNGGTDTLGLTSFSDAEVI